MPQLNEFILPVRVYIEDTDAGGIVYYVNYLKFMERARSEWMRNCGYDHYTLAERENAQFVVRKCDIQYRRPAIMDDYLEVLAKPTLKRASIDFLQQVTRDGEVLCQAQISIACVAADTLKPKALPPALVAAITKEQQ